LDKIYRQQSLRCWKSSLSISYIVHLTKIIGQDVLVLKKDFWMFHRNGVPLAKHPKSPDPTQFCYFAFNPLFLFFPNPLSFYWCPLPKFWILSEPPQSLIFADIQLWGSKIFSFTNIFCVKALIESAIEK
jgi:hypothetical protein